MTKYYFDWFSYKFPPVLTIHLNYSDIKTVKNDA